MKSKYFTHVFFLFLIFFTPACKKNEEGIKSDVIILGHGGIGFDSYINQLPPNTIVSITKAIDGLNADGVDIDLQLDNENTLWLYHGTRLEEWTSGSGCIGELTTSYLEQITYDKNINQSIVNNYHLQKLEEIFIKYSACTSKPKLFLDVNTYNKCYNIFQLADELLRLINKYNAFSWTQINSDNPELLIYLRSKSSQLQLFTEAINISQSIQDCITNNFNGLTARHYNISSEEINVCHQNNLKVTLWGMANYNETVSALKKHPDQIDTDNIELVCRIVGR